MLFRRKGRIGPMALAANFSAQVRQALDNMKTIVESAGLTMEHVVTPRSIWRTSKYDEMIFIFAEVPPDRLRRAQCWVSRVFRLLAH